MVFSGYFVFLFFILFPTFEVCLWRTFQISFIFLIWTSCRISDCQIHFYSTGFIPSLPRQHSSWNCHCFSSFIALHWFLAYNDTAIFMLRHSFLLRLGSRHVRNHFKIFVVLLSSHCVVVLLETTFLLHDPARPCLAIDLTQSIRTMRHNHARQLLSTGNDFMSNLCWQ